MALLFAKNISSNELKYDQENGINLKELFINYQSVKYIKYKTISFLNIIYLNKYKLFFTYVFENKIVNYVNKGITIFLLDINYDRSCSSWIL